MTKDETAMCKGVAIIMMIFHHLFYSLDVYSKYEINYVPFGQNVTYIISLSCKACVAIFVFLTAYGISKQFVVKKINNIQELKHYVVRRYFKLMCGFWFVFIFTWILELILGGGIM